ncbi:helix-turn-helix transcriptional regulator [Ruminococcus sp.]|jgi:predicted DNA-binding transcriptional regulator YafY|uniref:helix-turn-helix transcriptional regulator n=1 Tax=Ruminococcus sp. TaxID=41978 RepID=UPI003868AEF9
MPKNPKQKQKLLYIMKFFLEKTDEEYGVTVADIIDYLDDYGITAERKSIYNDIECLRDFGMDIVKSKVGKISLFSLVSRDFTLEEIKLLIDAVQSSKFITLKKSRELIRKIETLTSENQAKELHRQVIVANRVKNSNEEIYRNIDSINRAINKKRKIGFFYTQWAVSRTGAKKITKVRRHDGMRYLLTPKALTWDDENYYLIAYDKELDKLKHFRVDKMESISVEEERADSTKAVDKFDLAVYTKQVFGMYGGDTVNVKLRFDDSLIGVVIDRFSDKVFIQPHNDGSFTMSAEVMLSPQFYGWLFSFGDKVKIVSPKAAVNGFGEWLDSVKAQYE